MNIRNKIEEFYDKVHEDALGDGVSAFASIIFIAITLAILTGALVSAIFAVVTVIVMYPWIVLGLLVLFMLIHALVIIKRK